MVPPLLRASLIITRNPESQTVLGHLGRSHRTGTDTAWTFEPLGAEYGRQALRKAGWDGRDPVLIVCPINPFWWPVKPSLAKYAARVAHRRIQGKPLSHALFPQVGPEVDATYRKYIAEMAGAVKAFRETASRVSGSGRDGAAGRARLPRHGGKFARRACIHVGRIQHVSSS